MLSVYNPFISSDTVPNANPKACIGDSLYEWVVNTATNTLSRIRKDTYFRTNVIPLPNTNYTHITTGIYQGNNYIFTSSGQAGVGQAGGRIHRVMSIANNPSTTLTNITVSRTESTGTANAAGTLIAYSNGYLWLVPNSTPANANTHIIRLDIFNDINKTVFSYNTVTNACDSQVTVYTTNSTSLSSALLNASYSYIFGNFIYTLTNISGSVICKMSTLIPGASGIIPMTTNSNVYSYSYTGMGFSQLASDNVSYLWMAETSTTSGMIYRMSLNFNATTSTVSPTVGTGGIDSSFSSTLRSITAMKYGAGYLWISGKAVGVPSLVQVDVTTNTILNTLPLFIAAPPIAASNVTSIDIYNEYLWMTDSGNSALLKMKIYIPCFREGTKILCLTPQMKEEYIPIQDIRKGHLVKTSLNGFVPVCMIGRSGISNPGGNERIKNRLYKCSKSNYPELFEDLYITGCHSILVPNLTESQREKTMDALGDIFITDRKYRLMAYLDERSEPYTETGRYTIWHLALENNDYYMNYGIYANGLLVESTSQRYMKELSGMKLIE